jgi:hypothetical protein
MNSSPKDDRVCLTATACSKVLSWFLDTFAVAAERASGHAGATRASIQASRERL